MQVEKHRETVAPPGLEVENTGSLLDFGFSFRPADLRETACELPEVENAQPRSPGAGFGVSTELPEVESCHPEVENESHEVGNDSATVERSQRHVTEGPVEVENCRMMSATGRGEVEYCSSFSTW